MSDPSEAPPVYNPNRWLAPWLAIERAIKRDRCPGWMPSAEDRHHALLCRVASAEAEQAMERRATRQAAARRTLAKRRERLEAAA